MTQHYQVAAVLMDIEAALRNMGLWQAEAPPTEALRSEQPFAVDTLAFEQWLQFLFLPRMAFLLEQRQPLPQVCGIAPMAEEALQGRALPIAELIEALQQIDALLSA